MAVRPRLYFGSGGYRALISGGEAQAADFVRTLVRALKTGVGFEAAGGSAVPSPPWKSFPPASGRRMRLCSVILRRTGRLPLRAAGRTPSLFSVRREAYHAAIENDLPRLEHLLDVYEHAAEKLRLSFRLCPVAVLSAAGGVGASSRQRGRLCRRTDALLSALRAGGSFGQVKRLLLDAFKRMNRSEAPAREMNRPSQEAVPWTRPVVLFWKITQSPSRWIDIAEYAGVSPTI